MSCLHEEKKQAVGGGKGEGSQDKGAYNVGGALTNHLFLLYIKANEEQKAAGAETRSGGKK